MTRKADTPASGKHALGCYVEDAGICTCPAPPSSATEWVCPTCKDPYCGSPEHLLGKAPPPQAEERWLIRLNRDGNLMDAASMETGLRPAGDTRIIEVIPKRLLDAAKSELSDCEALRAAETLTIRRLEKELDAANERIRRIEEAYEPGLVTAYVEALDALDAEREERRKDRERHTRRMANIEEIASAHQTRGCRNCHLDLTRIAQLARKP